MKYYIIIPAHNEAKFLPLALRSVAEQTLLPEKLIVVDDNSTDNTTEVLLPFSAQYPWIDVVSATDSSTEHLPGGKVIQAFYQGLNTLDSHYDFVVKMDADIVLPPDYFATIAQIFGADPSVGIAGGLVYIEQKNKWVYEAIADKNHVRGPVKSYSKACFEKIGGLKPAIGWDTVDTLLARYHGFSIATTDTLIIKHLRPTGKAYSKKARLLRGHAMYTMRYGLLITFIASVKTAWKQKNPIVLSDNLKGYFQAGATQVPFLVTEDEGRFIRRYRWRGIRKKLGI